MWLGGGLYFSWLQSTFSLGQHYVSSQHTMCQWLQMLLLWQNNRSSDSRGCNCSCYNCSCYGTFGTIYSVFLPDGKDLSWSHRGSARAWLPESWLYMPRPQPPTPRSLGWMGKGLDVGWTWPRHSLWTRSMSVVATFFKEERAFLIHSESFVQSHWFSWKDLNLLLPFFCLFLIYFYFLKEMLIYTIFQTPTIWPCSPGVPF